jgi:hypothetical protein
VELAIAFAILVCPVVMAVMMLWMVRSMRGDHRDGERGPDGE